MRKLLWIFIFFLLNIQLYSAKDFRVDSLQSIIKNAESEDTTRVLALLDLSRTYTRSNPDSAISCLNHAYKIASEIDYIKGIASTFRLKAYFYYSNNNYNESINNFFKAISYYKNFESILLKSVSEYEDLANLYNTVGVIFYYQANYDKSLEYYNNSIEIFSKIGDKTGISNCYNNIGIIYNNLNELSKALSFHFKSLSIKFELNDQRGVATSYNNIGEIYRAQNMFDKALIYYYKSLQIKDSINDLSGIATSCNNIGFIYLEKNKFDSANYFLNRSLKISLELDEQFDIAESYLNFGNYYNKINKKNEAITYYKKALEIATKIGAPELIKSSSEKLIETYKSINDYKNAFEYSLIHKQIIEKLYNEENVKKIAQLEAKQEFLQKEKNAEFAQKQKDIIQKSKLNRQKIIMYASLIGFILTILLILVVFKNYKNKKNANILLEIQKEQIKNEKKLSDKLLLNILPADIAEELKINGKASPKQYDRVSVLFADFTGFTKLCEKIQPIDLISELDVYFEKIDSIIEKNKIEKIKTVGDAYMCAGGLPIINKSNPIDTVLAALEIQDYLQKVNSEKKLNNLPLWTLRIGIHTGQLVAGVIGKNKFAYDIWGDTVNVAARMEASGEENKVNISGETYSYIMNYFDCTFRGKIQAKNKGEIDMYFVDRIKPEYSADENGFYPNRHLLSIIKEINQES